MAGRVAVEASCVDSLYVSGIVKTGGEPKEGPPHRHLELHWTFTSIREARLYAVCERLYTVETSGRYRSVNSLGIDEKTFGISRELTMTKRNAHSTRTETVRSKDGTPIAFDRSGAGPPLILVDGALADRSAGTPLAALLASHFTVYAYDRRGRGDSGDAESYAVEREVDDLEALVTDAGGSAFVFGTSSGAVLALEATARGLDIEKLALYEPPFRVDESGPQPPADLGTQLEDLLSAGRRGDAVERFLTNAVGMPADAVAEMRTEPMWPALEALAPTLVYDLAVVGDGSLPTDRLESVTAPTLAVDGAESPSWARHAVRAVADVLPDAQYRSLEGQTHDIAPDALAPALEEFFAR